MRIDIIAAVPKLLESPLSHSILKKAQEKGIVEIFVHDIRDYATNKHKQIDDKQFGGGAGMVLMAEPIGIIINKLKNERNYKQIIYLTPDAPILTQKTANLLSLSQNLILLCGHYKGIDQRIRDIYITQEISIGNYVLTGGELAAAILTDAIVRLIPGAIGNEQSALTDSFQDDLLSPPIYTHPRNYQGIDVPEVLLSGNFAHIEKWRYLQALEKTEALKPYLLNEENQ